MPSRSKVNKRLLKTKTDLCLAATPQTKTREKNGKHLPSSSNSTSIKLESTWSLAPRFTNDEKRVLFGLFRQHENVIDIKYRKHRKGKLSIREAWQKILDDFNRHSNVSIQRNLKQIQKFWLNARLRKQFTSKSVKETKLYASTSEPIINNAAVAAPMKSEPKLDFQKESSTIYEDIVYTVSTSEQLNTRNTPEIVLSQENYHDQIDNENNIHQEQRITQLQQQQIHFDNISPEKLSLNDLLQFKNNTRPNEDIIFEIKHSGDKPLTLPTQHQVTIAQQIAIDQVDIIDDNKVKVQQYQINSPQATQSKFQQQFRNFTTQGNNFNSRNIIKAVPSESFEDKINFFQQKEIELRQKEVKLKAEQKRIEILQMEEELRYQKEIHKLQVENLRIKLRILYEEEKQLRIKKINL